MTSIPIYNVNNNCSIGDIGLYMARHAVAYGVAYCALVVGFEKMVPGRLQSYFKDREHPMGTLNAALPSKSPGNTTDTPDVTQLFGNSGKEYMEKYGATAQELAEIARINHVHSSDNPYSQFTDNYTLQEILESPMIHAPSTRLQCCSTSDGAAAAVVVSQDFLDQHPHLIPQAIQILGQQLTTDHPDLFEHSSINLIGYKTSQLAS